MSRRRIVQKHLFDKQDLFNKIDNLSITNDSNVIVTKYNNRTIKTVLVSDRYEIYDFTTYAKSIINSLMERYDISEYTFDIRGGIQEIRLFSDTIMIGQDPYQKVFYLLSSSDKSRVLSFDAGLYRVKSKSYIIRNVDGFSFRKRHLNGVTDKANISFDKIDFGFFTDQINTITNLYDKTIKLSKLREIIVEKMDVKTYHYKFDTFKNKVIHSNNSNSDLNCFSYGLSTNDINMLRTPSASMVINNSNDVVLSAYESFLAYMDIFKSMDSYIIKKETERILKMTQEVIIDDTINSILGI